MEWYLSLGTLSPTRPVFWVEDLVLSYLVPRRVKSEDVCGGKGLLGAEKSRE